MLAPSPVRAEGSRATRLCLAAILLLSFALRAIYVLQSRGSPVFAQPAMDALYHLEWARAFAAGRDFQPGPFFRAPLYPWFLGLLLRAAGENLLLVRLVQAAIGTASVGLVYLAGARAFDARTGLLGALFAGISWVTIYFEGDFLLPVLEVFFDLLAIWLALRVDEKRTPLRAALAGAAFGAAALVRPNVLLFAPLVALWILLRARNRAEDPVRPAQSSPAQSKPAQSKSVRPLAAALVFLAAFAAPIAPVTAYNGLVGKDWVLVSSQGGVNFWIGNNPSSDGASAVVPGARLDWWGGYQDSIRMAEAEEGRALKPSEVSRHYAAKAWAWIRAEPRAALVHTLWKLRLFWTDWEISNDASERFFAFRYGPILRALPFGFAALAPLAVLGFLLAARDRRRLFPLWAFLPVYTASVVAFFVCSRFRVPVLPVMAILAAHACWRLVAMVRARAIPGLIGSAACLAAAVAFVENVPASIDTSDSKGEWELGVYAFQRGEDAAAVEHFETSIALNGRYSTAHADLGGALRRLGRDAEAEESLRRAIAIDPRNVVAIGSLFDLLLASGRLEEAGALARQAVAVAPAYAPARYDLGRLAFFDADAMKRAVADPARVRERLEEGLRELGRGLALAADATTGFNCAYAAGRIERELGRPADALRSFERALAAQTQVPSSPDDAAWWWRCQQDLLDSLRASGRADEAERRRGELARRFPGASVLH